MPPKLSAKQRVAKARELAARQRDRIAALKQVNGHDGKSLAAFERSLAIFEDELANRTHAEPDLASRVNATGET